MFKKNYQVKINWNYIKAFFLITLVLFLFGFTNYRNEQQKITIVNVKFEEGENLFMNYEMVNKLLIQNDEEVTNKTKSLIDLNSLEKQVLSHPMVENATAYITVDGQLRISVKQRTPIGRINTNNGSYYIDKQGQFMPLSKNYSARVPIVTGVSPSENIDDLYELLSFITNDNFLQKQIVGVQIVGKDEFILTTRVGNHKIDFGNLEDKKIKFKNLKAFYSFTMKNEAIDNYKKISLKYNNQVVATKKD